jgi:hypothetical protein
MPLKNMLGKTFGRLIVKASAGSDKRQGALWRALCSCGNTVPVVRGTDLRSGNTTRAAQVHSPNGQRKNLGGRCERPNGTQSTAG